MKLSLKQHEELRRLARVFDKMENMANGMDADPTIDFSLPTAGTTKGSLLEIAFKRRNAILENRMSPERTETTHFTVIVNEERF